MALIGWVFVPAAPAVVDHKVVQVELFVDTSTRYARRVAPDNAGLSRKRSISRFTANDSP
jgi:hypothetical protein